MWGGGYPELRFYARIWSGLIYCCVLLTRKLLRNRLSADGSQYVAEDIALLCGTSVDDFLPHLGSGRLIFALELATAGAGYWNSAETVETYVDRPQSSVVV